ncbi:MAG: glycosyltransferase family 39 protein [Candidatus Auribacterota bacterium]|nr:glycosyltransferase family 39 protein [Candidatus Auribacterota bacterium]
MTEKRKNKSIWGWLSIILLLSLVLRFYALDQCRFIGTDGGVDGVAMTICGRSLVTGEGFTFQGRPELAHAPLFPWVAGIIWFLTGNLELSGLLISVLAGALSVIPIFFLAKRLFGITTAWIAAWMTAVFPPFIFAATEVRLASLYLFIFLLVANALYKNALAPGFLRGGMVGLTGGLAYLARPEGAIFLPLGILLSFFSGPIFKRGKKILFSALGMVLVFSLLSAPYWDFLHRHLGYWTLSARSPVTFIPYFSENWEDANFMAYAYPDKVREQWQETGGLVGVIRDHGDEMIARFLENLCVIFTIGESPEFRRMKVPPWPVNLFSVLVVGFVVLLVGYKIRLRRWRFRDTFLVLLSLPMLPYMFLTDFMTSQKLRYFYPYFSFLIILISYLPALWLRRQGNRRPINFLSRVLGWGPSVVLVGVMTICSLYLIPRKKARVPYEYKIMGEWMRDNLPGIASATVMSHRMGVPFYAGARHVQTHPGDYNDVLSYAGETGAEYLMVNDWTTPRLRPELEFLLIEESPPELELIHEVNFSGRKALLYRFK